MTCVPPFNAAFNLTQFVETAIVKLCVQLTDHAASVGSSGAFESWEGMVGSLANIDVQDLLTFLDENRAPHVKALLCRWNGDVKGALETWKR